MGFVFGFDVDNHAINTVPKETLVRITKAERRSGGGRRVVRGDHRQEPGRRGPIHAAVPGRSVRHHQGAVDDEGPRRDDPFELVGSPGPVAVDEESDRETAAVSSRSSP
jgi:hypothetical protein